MQQHNAKQNPLPSGMGSIKTYYGFEAEVDIRCRKCGDNFQVNVSGEEQASGFDECC